MTTYREMCRHRGYCLVEDRHIILEERHYRRLRLFYHFRDVRNGWRDLRRASRNLRRMIGVVFRVNVFLRLVSKITG
jgi:hypothetical protein